MEILIELVVSIDNFHKNILDEQKVPQKLSLSAAQQIPKTRTGMRDL